MNPVPEAKLQQLAQAAFLQAARKLVMRAEQTGLPLILSIDGEIRAVAAEDLPKFGIIIPTVCESSGTNP